MLMTVKSLSFVARITGNWKSLLVGKGSRVSRHPLNFCRVQTDSEEAKASYRGGYPAAIRKNRTYVHILYRKRGDLSREIWEIVENG